MNVRTRASEYGFLMGALALAAVAVGCGPVKAQEIDCQDVAACGDHGACDDSSGQARCICDVGYTGATCQLCDSGYELDSNQECVEIVTCESFCAHQGRVCDSVQGDIICGDCLEGWFEEEGRCIQACDAVRNPGQLVPLDIYIMLDRSSSMQDAGKWTAMTSALTTFVTSSDTAGIGVGLQFFPLEPTGTIPGACSSDADCGYYGPCLPVMNVCGGSMATDTSCDPADYDEAAVDIVELPGGSSALSTAISGESAQGSATPTTPAFNGAYTYAMAWAQAHPTHLTYILFATDGMPTGCSSGSLDSPETLAAQALAANPSVQTYVFGVESDAENIDLDYLNEIAQAGGTGMAILVDSQGTVTQTFIDTLNDIRSNAACKYQLPVPENGILDPDLINVSLVDPNNPGSAETIFNTVNEAGCGTDGGWYYDNPNDPTMILLCPSTCDEASLNGLEVEILVGCATIVK